MDIAKVFNTVNEFAQKFSRLHKRLNDARLADEGITLDPDEVKTVMQALESMARSRRG